MPTPRGYIMAMDQHSFMSLILVSKWNTYTLLCVHFSVSISQLYIRRETEAGNWSSLWIFKP